VKRTLMSVSRHALGPSLVIASVMASACGDEPSILRPEGRLDFEPDRPELMPGEESSEYTGTDMFVMEAQTTHRTGLELHRNVITRTCGPTAASATTRKNTRTCTRLRTCWPR
jgi:hypothetical protein